MGINLMRCRLVYPCPCVVKTSSGLSPRAIDKLTVSGSVAGEAGGAIAPVAPLAADFRVSSAPEGYSVTAKQSLSLGGMFEVT